MNFHQGAGFDQDRGHSRLQTGTKRIHNFVFDTAHIAYVPKLL